MILASIRLSRRTDHVSKPSSAGQYEQSLICLTSLERRLWGRRICRALANPRPTLQRNIDRYGLEGAVGLLAAYCWLIPAALATPLIVIAYVAFRGKVALGVATALEVVGFVTLAIGFLRGAVAARASRGSRQTRL